MDPSIGLITLNAKFIHSSLSLRYLRNAATANGHKNVWTKEFVINQPTWKIAAEIQKMKPDIVGIGVYIWNRRQSFDLIELLRKQNPAISIAIGGPEVSFESELSEHYTLISGEGENKWTEFLDYHQRNETPSREVQERWNTYGTDLPDLLPPYIDEDFPDLQNRIVYFETSRGCPYLCSFCLSALDKQVRYFDDNIVHDQVERLIGSGVKKIKFVDRTFNLKQERMREFMRWLTRFEGAEFHFEVVGDILNDETIAFLESVPRGMFQFEIGIQTTNPEAQNTIQRKQDNGRLFSVIEKLVQQDKVHFHCDLIFGLPGETLDESLDSFTKVFLLKPHELQLGFLKFLPGTPVKELIESYQYQYQSQPPYEFISHKDLSAEEGIYLKKFAEVFNLFYNSKRFSFSIDHLLQNRTPVEIFNQLLDYLESNDLFNRPHSLDEQYRIFSRTFDSEENPLALDLLKLDYLYHQRVFRLPAFMKNNGQGTGEAFKTWRGDRKTPLVPFLHEIKVSGSRVHLIPVATPLNYAISHPEEKSGYLSQPRIERVEV